jgi:hypothetical protein
MKKTHGWSRTLCKLAAPTIVIAMLCYSYFFYSAAMTATMPQLGDTDNFEGKTHLTVDAKSTKNGYIAPYADLNDFSDFGTIQNYYQTRLLPLKGIVGNWPPMLPDSKPADWKDLVPHFDWTDLKSREAAQRVRDAEMPFIIRNVPEVVAAAKRWDPAFLASHFGAKMGKVERSDSHSFMYWRKRRGYKDYEPTTIVQMPWSKFVEEAKALDASDGRPFHPHFYWITSVSKDPWLRNELPLYDKNNSFFVVDPLELVPISCKIGTKGLCNELHYDGHRTFASQLVGSKRWIFMPPSECSKLYLYQDDHPSSRHSPVDINSGRINGTAFPLAMSAMAIETVIHAGEVAYLPSNWFHHIISPEFNVQCIARSGHSLEGDDYIEKCGFKGGQRSMRKSGRSEQDIKSALGRKPNT